MPAKPEILKQREAARSRFFYVEEIELRFSNGVERTYERLRTGGFGAVMVVALLDDETVLLIREYAAGFHEYQLSLPKGAVDRGESLVEAANRELKEEAGYGARHIEVLKEMSLSPAYMEHTLTVLLARDLYEQRLRGDEPEEIEVVPYKLANIHELVERADFTEARAIAALYMVRDKIKQQKEQL